jgi:pilus assembly protein Flp/PilA
MIKRFLRDERGLETVEYAIISGLIVAGMLTTLISIGAWVNAKFAALDAALATS